MWTAHSSSFLARAIQTLALAVALGLAAESTAQTPSGPRWAGVHLKSDHHLEQAEINAVVRQLQAALGGEWRVLDQPRDGQRSRLDRAIRNVTQVTGPYSDVQDFLDVAAWYLELYRSADRNRFPLADDEPYSPQWLKDGVALGWWYAVTGGGFIQVFDDSLRAVFTGSAYDEAKAIYEITRSIQVLKDAVLPWHYSLAFEVTASPGLTIIPGGGRPSPDDPDDADQREVTAGGVSVQSRRARSGGRGGWSNGSDDTSEGDGGDVDDRSRSGAAGNQSRSGGAWGDRRDPAPSRGDGSDSGNGGGNTASSGDHDPPDPPSRERDDEGGQSDSDRDSTDDGSGPSDGNSSTPRYGSDATDDVFAVPVFRFLPPGDGTKRPRARQGEERSDIGALVIPKGAPDNRKAMEQMRDLRNGGLVVLPKRRGPDDSEKPRPASDPNAASGTPTDNDLGDDLPHRLQGGTIQVGPIAPDWWLQNGPRAQPVK